jgi:zona occludens toxin (predicted ATPase)
LVLVENIIIENRQNQNSKNIIFLFNKKKKNDKFEIYQAMTTKKKSNTKNKQENI